MMGLGASQGFWNEMSRFHLDPLSYLCGLQLLRSLTTWIRLLGKEDDAMQLISSPKTNPLLNMVCVLHARIMGFVS